MAHLNEGNGVMFIDSEQLEESGVPKHHHGHVNVGIGIIVAAVFLAFIGKIIFG